jgi:hypothetical protein
MAGITKHDLATILRKQCEAVGADYYSIDFKADKWYELYSWTEKEELDFSKWLTGFLKRRGDRMQRKNPEKYIAWWLLCYGWKKKYVEVKFNEGN